MKRQLRGFALMFLLFCIFTSLNGNFVFADDYDDYPIATNFRYPLGDGTKQTFEEYGSSRGFAECIDERGRHLAIDVSTPTGTKLYAVEAGKVVISDNMAIGGYGDCCGGAGYVVVIEHKLNDPDIVCSLYGHVNNEDYDRENEVGLIPNGTIVERGQYIATIADYWSDSNVSGVCGDEGDQNWDHLHFGIRKESYNDAEWFRYIRGYSYYKYQDEEESLLLWYEDIDVDIGKICDERINLGGNWTSPIAFVDSHQPDPTRSMDFEDGVDRQPIQSKIPGMVFTTTDGQDWIYGDWREGYNGPYPEGDYYSNGNFFAWLGEVQDTGRIDFTGATATYLSVMTSTYSGLTMDAYDIDDNWLANSGWAGYNLGTGEMTKLTVAAPNMAYVLVYDSGNRWLIDDLEIGDLLAEAKAYLPASFTAEYEDIDTLDQDQSKWKTFFNEIYQTLKIILGWGGSELSIQIYKPNGDLYGEYQSDMPPIIIDIPNAEPGQWEFEVTAVDVPCDDYPFALVVGATDDTTPPEITVTVSPDTLWPPNHKMVLITPEITVADNCDPDPVVQLTSITMNEGEDDDIYIDENGNIYLRAERSGKGDGRIYTITCTATDASGNSASASDTVIVPHNK